MHLHDRAGKLASLYMILIFFQDSCDIKFVVIHVDLPAPNNVRAKVLSHSSVEVTWDQLPDATEYIMSYSTTASHNSDKSVTVKGGCTKNHTLTNLEENTPYIITVQATASGGRKSEISSEVSVTTHAAGKLAIHII